MTDTNRNEIGIDLMLHLWTGAEPKLVFELDARNSVLRIKYAEKRPVTMFLSPAQTQSICERIANGTLFEIEGEVPASPPAAAAIARLAEPIVDDEVPF